MNCDLISDAVPFVSEWTVWVRPKSNTGYTVSDYIECYKFSTVQGMWIVIDKLCKTSPRILSANEFYVMRGEITPVWEDPMNAKGGCHTTKLSNPLAADSPKHDSASLSMLAEMMMSVCGESSPLSKHNVEDRGQVKRHVTGFSWIYSKFSTACRIWVASSASQGIGSGLFHGPRPIKSWYSSHKI